MSECCARASEREDDLVVTLEREATDHHDYRRDHDKDIHNSLNGSHTGSLLTCKTERCKRVVAVIQANP